MIETIVIGLICVCLAYLGRYRRLSWGFGAAMTILFVFLAIRYEWGNDYRQYIEYIIRLMNLIIQILTNDGKSVGYSCIGYSNHSVFFHWSLSLLHLKYLFIIGLSRNIYRRNGIGSLYLFMYLILISCLRNRL